METPRNLGSRIGGHLRAAAIAAASSMIVIAAMLAIVHIYGPNPDLAYVWIGVSIVLAGLGVRVGHRVPPRGFLAIVGRALSVLLLGTTLLAIVLMPLVLNDVSRPVGAGIFTAVGVALLLVTIRVSPRRASLEEEAPPLAPEVTSGPLPAAPPEEPGSSYALIGGGPAVAAAESERSTLAVEVRVLWGGDLLRVIHLDPPRSFVAGWIDCDLALSREMLGTDTAVLVVAAPSPRVDVPPGAKAIVERGGEEGSVTRREDADAGASIPLDLDTRVTMTFSARSSSAYRAPANDAPVAVEIALVRAGKIVGRRPAFGRALPPLASFVLSGAAVAGVMALAASEAPPFLPDRDEVSPSRAGEIAAALDAAAEKQEDGEEDRRPPRWPFRGSWRFDSYFYEAPAFFPYGRYGPSTLDAFPEVAHLYCRMHSDGYRDPGILGWDLGANYCGSQVVTPLGMRWAWTPYPDALGRDPLDMWSLSQPLLPEAPNGRVHVEPAAIRGPASPDYVARVMRGHYPRVRRCYRQQLLASPQLVGKVRVRFVIGADGAISNIGNGGTDLVDATTVSCVVRAFYSLSFPEARGGITTVTQPIDFSP